METLDRRVLLRRGAGFAAAVCGWGLVSDARGASDPRLTALQRLVKGPVIVPSSPTYNQARLVDQERFDDVRPLGIVQPVSPADVSQILAWSRRTRIPIAIRAGGHSYGGYSTTSGVVVDLGRLGSITLARSSGVVSVGAGARL